MSHSRSIRLVFPVAAGVVVAAAGCGSSGNAASPPVTTVTPTVVVTPPSTSSPQTTSSSAPTATAPPVTTTVTVRPTTPSQTSSSSSSTSSTAPAAAPNYVVGAYFDAISNHDYGTAWNLGGDHLSPSYQAFVSGFSNTTRDDLRILSVNGDVVSVRFNSDHPDGTATVYQGTYTVHGGQIVAANVAQVGTLP